jgi:hypothetical protein
MALNIRRLTLGGLTDAELKELAQHGEDLFLDRKEAIPADGIGRTVAAFANTLGGWVLLGVDDDGESKGFELPGRADAQAHIGQLLANEVDPMPPYLAAKRELGGHPVIVIRVFQSSDTPHILRKTGAVPIRTTAGTRPVTDQRLLLELARRGEEALARAHEARIKSDLLVRGLPTDERPTEFATADNVLAVIVRAALVTLTPAFTDWAISEAGAEICRGQSNKLSSAMSVSAPDADVKPYGRGVAAGWRGGHLFPVSGNVVIDAGGAVGARVWREPAGDTHDEMSLGGVVQRHVRPLIRTVAGALDESEAHGRTAWRLDINRPPNYRLRDVPTMPWRFFASADLSLPPAEDELDQLTKAWGSEYARECEIPEWQP